MFPWRWLKNEHFPQESTAPFAVEVIENIFSIFGWQINVTLGAVKSYKIKNEGSCLLLNQLI